MEADMPDLKNRMNTQFREIEEFQDLYLLQEKDIDAAANCNADAYMDYELLKQILQDKFDYDILRKLWTISIKSLKNEALFVADSPQLKGFSIWAPAGFKGSKIIPFFKAGGLTLPIPILMRLERYEQYSMKLKKKYTGHNGWYLYDLVVRRDCQNHGIAKKILNPVLDYIERSGQSCSLETHNTANVDIYRKFGFELIETGNVPGLNIRHYAMLKRI